MQYSGISFMIAAIILCAAEHIAMIVIGRVLQGIAVRFPPCDRHASACLAQLNLTVICLSGLLAVLTYSQPSTCSLIWHVLMRLSSQMCRCSADLVRLGGCAYLQQVWPNRASCSAS